MRLLDLADLHTSLQQEPLQPFGAFLQQLPSLRVLGFWSEAPRVLFLPSALSRLTRLGLPAPVPSSLDDAYYLLQQLPKLKALALGGRLQRVQRDLPALSCLTQLEKLYIFATLVVALPPNLRSLTLDLYSDDFTSTHALQISSQLTFLRLHSSVGENLQLSAQQPSALAHLFLQLSAPEVPDADLTALTKLTLQIDNAEAGYLAKLNKLR